MAMHLGIIPTSNCLLPPLICRRAAAVHQRKPNHPAPLAFTFHNKSCRFSRLITPIRSAAGSSGSVSATTYKDIANYLEKVEVFDLSRKAVQIVDLWRDRKAVVAFARHFGSSSLTFLRQLLSDDFDAEPPSSSTLQHGLTASSSLLTFLQRLLFGDFDAEDLMDATGVALVLIAPGTVDQAIAFFEQTQFKGEVYADPTHSSFDALNFAYGVTTTITPKAGMKIIESYLEGYRQDWGLSFKDNTMSKGGWQQGGIMVAGPGTSNISYLHKDKEAGDDPNIEDVLAACCS